MRTERYDVEIVVGGHVSATFVTENLKKAMKVRAAVKTIKADCIVTNPKYVSLLRAGRDTRWCDKSLALYKIVPSDRGMKIKIDRGYIRRMIDILAENELSYRVTDARADSSDIGLGCDSLKINGNEVKFRPDQASLIEDAVKPLLAGNKGFGVVENVAPEMMDGVVVAPTGAGKTIIAMELMRRVDRPFIVSVNSRNLAKQWVEKIEHCMGVKAVMLSGKNWPDPKEHKVVVAMQQTVSRQLERWREFTKHYVSIIFDEAHRVPAMTARNVAANSLCRCRLGFSATPERADGLTQVIHLALGKTIAEVSVEEVRSHGGVTPVVVCPYIFSGINHDAVDEWGNFIEAVIGDKERNRIISNMAVRASEKMNTVILTGRVNHAELLYEIVKDSVDDATLIHGKLKADERRQAIEEMKTSSLTVGTYQMIGEGIDVPGWSAIIFAMPFSSKTNTLQRLGRIARPMPGKKEGFVADIIDDIGFGWSSWKKRGRGYKKAKVEFMDPQRISLL